MCICVYVPVCACGVHVCACGVHVCLPVLLYAQVDITLPLNLPLNIYNVVYAKTLGPLPAYSLYIYLIYIYIYIHIYTTRTKSSSHPGFLVETQLLKPISFSSRRMVRAEIFLGTFVEHAIVSC